MSRHRRRRCCRRCCRPVCRIGRFRISRTFLLGLLLILAVRNLNNSQNINTNYINLNGENIEDFHEETCDCECNC